GMLLEQGVKAEVLGHPPEGRHGAEVADECGVRAIGLLEASEQVVGFAQVGQDDGSGFAVDPSALHDLPVGMSADDLVNQTRHEFSVYNHSNKSRDRADFAENTGENCPPEGKWIVAEFSVYNSPIATPSRTRN